jgi:hypothetical protein
VARPAVQTSGFKELRRDLRKVDKALPRELNKQLRQAVAPAAEDAARRAPRSDRDRSGWAYKRHLADTIRPYATARSVGLRSPAPHARIVERGGRRPLDTRHRANWTQVAGRHFMDDAIRGRVDEVVDAIGDAVENVASRAGWR